MQHLSANQVKEKVLELGFHKVGIVDVQTYVVPQQGDDSSVSHLKNWLNQGRNSSMDWMTDSRRKAIQSVMPEVKSVISVAMNYYTPQQRRNDPANAKISRYGWGRDYHKVITKRLKIFSTWLVLQNDLLYPS